MDQVYNSKMNELGYNQLVCDIFLNWEDVKDEILLPERKQGSGNGTIHVFLGAADAALREEFPSYYEAVDNGEDTSVGAIEVKHYFTPSNIISMLGYVCKYLHEKEQEVDSTVSSILEYLATSQDESGLLYTKSLLKLSVGSNKLRPYFKQFESNGVFTKLVRQILLPNSSYKISLYKNEDGEYAAFWLIGFNWLNDFEADSSGEHIENPQAPKKEPDLSLNLQQIYYGAPGTGKSYKINEITKSTKNFTRTTFHPDSDYSTFVGCYKPTMEPTGTIVGGKEQTKISYSYVAQAFLQAYTAAWKNTSEPYYLIIEEINRGNCAQIFGDLFQLLDRDENGMSSYGITPDKDIANYLKKEFAKSEIENADIKSGNTMMLPSNLYILATMNTSDQSLFPIDSAFKRRWDWEYVPIEDVGKKHYIKVGNKKYDWWTFIDTINNSIDHITGSEDKKMGYWFVKPQNNDREITAKQFVGKVLFYLWNDVYKDYFDMSQCIFKIKNEDGTDEKKPFTYFFGSEADKRIQAFMAYNKIPFITIEDNVDVEDDDDNEDNDGKEATDTETQMKQRNLWTLFNQIMKSKGRNEASREAQGKSKYDIRFKTTGMFIRNTVHVVGNSTTPASVYSEIHFKPTAQNLYEVIESKKDELQELFELPIVWRNPNGTHVGKIERQVNFNDENDKEAGMTWLAETSAKLYDYLKPIVDENK
ncbi:MAG: DUF4268 domain-containing protein [Prevotella sp.]|nr:DUF4268 domain-containing protein [Prevotella sp.]